MKNKNMNSIKRAIRKSGKTQIEVAAVLGIRPDSFSTAMTRKTLNVEQLEKIAEFINAPLPYLFDTGIENICPHCKRPIKIKITE